MKPTRTTTRASPATTTTTTLVTNAHLKALIKQGVADALAACDTDRSQNGDDSYNSGTGSRRTERKCTNTDFLKCQPMNFKGTKGVVGLTQWFEIMETIFNIRCRSQHALEHTYEDDDYQELALLCGRMFLEESGKIEKYVGGLPDMIHGSVMASKPKTMQDAVEFATELMDMKIRTFAERQTENKRKQDDNQQQQHKRENTGRAYTAGPKEKKLYGGSKPRSDCSELKNQNHGNQTRGTRARRMVHALGGGETNQDLNNMEDDINT
nr:hypothetical protein [Tanacetum cinerariifolium]